MKEKIARELFESFKRRTGYNYGEFDALSGIVQGNYRKDAEAIVALINEWNPMETAPRDGTEFLAVLSNGWVVIMSETPNHGNYRYDWYRVQGNISVPIERTHPAGSLKNSLTAKGWKPMPEIPEELK